jgi:two-component system phosphate regulon response regulator PhoB
MAKVLIAEDDSSIRALIRMTLDSGRFEILEAGDGESALVAAREERPDLLFLDWNMPGRDGIDVCRELRSEPSMRHTKIVLVTGCVRPEDRRAALDAGADDYITKPFSPLFLLDKVTEVLGPEAMAERPGSEDAASAPASAPGG